MNNLCRTCLGSALKLVHLENSTDIITKIETIASIEVSIHIYIFLLEWYLTLCTYLMLGNNARQITKLCM